MRQPEKRGLGRGLSALMADVKIEPAAERGEATRGKADLMVALDLLEPNPDQPRRMFAQEALQELSDSIREKGVIQPLIVRPSKRSEGRFEIVAGERRWRASQLAQQHEVPVIVRELDDIEVLEIAIIENIQRADLNPLEEAMGYRQLMDRFGHTQDKVAEALGKSRSHIANLLRLLQLPEEVQGHLREGRLSAGHARALITTEDPAKLARQVIKGQLSVRATEKLAKAGSGPKPRRVPPPLAKDADTRALEQDLAANLGVGVSIEHRTDGSGDLVLSYASLEELDRLCAALSSPGGGFD
ncbi:chromosome partitioning protein ParB [Rhodovulum sulfidophilum]|uniref:ParB/RepB/Spo0J family partition protein n=1 Tax=Rhodovulum visakhapatnamense TaxID=364297 RepID=A0ABS1RAC4_9RHOB|nr:ParB/RepB/Spo0J family partition protein [Rhodovulum visakhapatnamense]MBL3568268.1 ParB/RepB/Spo0J family partition protein [Rhodovulum visakhapatnamense]MBL3576594.1 ParB/RepB/Spo0J family partition protein [Rhodovulum visakhapatnamense]OLS43217.1 chromosome partitioning protein ParB [Rhodovulum sulfidophilum]